MPFGYCGKILRINLSTKHIEVIRKDDEWYRTYLGGRNFAAYFMLKEIPNNADPLGADNKLICATSVITGSIIPGSSRFTVAAKSPLSNGYGEAEAGGWWGPELKKAGYDALIIEGVSSSPVYLFIKNGKCEIKEADHLWGKDTGEVEQLIREENEDPKIRVLQTGIAGENLVRYAAVTNELRHWAGRTGMGAVMGSKKLRAIAVRGKEKIEINQPDKLKEYAKWFAENLPKHEGLSKRGSMGTAGVVIPVNESGMLPTLNFRKGQFADAAEISGEKLLETVDTGRDSCFACPVRCKHKVEYHCDTMDIDSKYGGPEFETIGTIGSNCGIRDHLIVCKANELCGRYGMDTVSTGGTIAFAMECFEKNIISLKDTDNIELRFGNGEALLEMINKIAHREGIGDVLAEGSFRASEVFGKDSKQFVMTTKKQEFPAHEPRGKWGVALQYAISPTGGDHLVAAHDVWFSGPGNDTDRFTYMDINELKKFGIRKPVDQLTLNEDKIRLFIHLQAMWSLYNVLGLCIFIGVPEWKMASFEQIIDAINFVTGWDISFWEAVKAGEKGILMSRLFNIKQGFTEKDDRLPERLFTPLEEGPFDGIAIDKREFEEALKNYYLSMGWNEHGTPTYGKFIELGITEVYT